MRCNIRKSIVQFEPEPWPHIVYTQFNKVDELRRNELRRLVHAARWKRQDPVIQLPPASAHEMTYSVITGLSIEHTQTLESGTASTTSTARWGARRLNSYGLARPAPRADKRLSPGCTSFAPCGRVRANLAGAGCSRARTIRRSREQTSSRLITSAAAKSSKPQRTVPTASEQHWPADPRPALSRQMLDSLLCHRTPPYATGCLGPL